MCLGIPGKVLEIHTPDGGMPMGKVEFGGIARDVCLVYLPEVVVGDWVLVHVGFALSKLDEQEAREIFSYIEQIGELAEADELAMPDELPDELPEALSPAEREGEGAA
ncbi:MAG: HypC/HybG/HupF family hydrogenase formation chaperone [Planctomycetaceae bacterium]|nr:HypC/HybG/HupF family hydrogenase formation chaperone [Planctomycetaceae bacterium]